MDDEDEMDRIILEKSRSLRKKKSIRKTPRRKGDGKLLSNSFDNVEKLRGSPTRKEKIFLEKATSDEKYKGKSGLFKRSPLRLINKMAKSRSNKTGQEESGVMNVQGGMGDNRLSPRNEDSGFRSTSPSPRGASDNLERAISSKRRSSFSGFINGLLPKSSSNSSVGSSSTASSTNSSPRWVSVSYYDAFKCANCPKKLDLNMTTSKMLAVRCTCHPAEFFCSRHCHRVHWIVHRKCEENRFTNVPEDKFYDDHGRRIEDRSVFDIPITWAEIEFVHNMDDFFPDLSDEGTSGESKSEG